MIVRELLTEQQAEALGEDQRDTAHRDPVAQQHLDAAQDRYERALGWGCD